MKKGRQGESLINRNITVVNGDTREHMRTSIRLERLEWRALDYICATENISISDFCKKADLDENRQERSRTSRIRMAILAYFMSLGGVDDEALDSVSGPKRGRSLRAR